MGWNHSSGTITNSYRNTGATVTALQNGMMGTIRTDGTGLTEAQFILTSGTYPSNLDTMIWDLGTAMQYPGLCIGGKIHRPMGSATPAPGSFTIDSSAACTP